MSYTSPEYTYTIPDDEDSPSIVRQLHQDGGVSYIRLPEPETLSRRDVLTEGVIGAAAVGIVVGGVGALAWQRIAKKMASADRHSTNGDSSQNH